MWFSSGKIKKERAKTDFVGMKIRRRPSLPVSRFRYNQFIQLSE